MEIQKTTAQPSSLGLKVNEAVVHPLKIATAHEQDLINALGYCFATLGFKEENYPKGLHRAFLIEFIRSNYRIYAVEEIKTAFLMLVKGELGDKSPKHYNNFSPEYFGAVMACYKSHREKACLELQYVSNRVEEEPYEPDTIEKTKIQREFDTVVLAPIFEKFKQYGCLELGTTPAKIVFNSLIGFHNIMQFTNEQKLEIKEQAKQIIDERREKLKNGKAMTYQDHKRKLEMINDLMKAEFVDDEIITECHKICIFKCFQKMEVSNFKF